MKIDEYDIKMLKENFDSDLISKADFENVAYILKYLFDDGVYYAKDLLLNAFDLFLLRYDDFVQRFEKLKRELGSNYIDKLGDDISLIEIMY